MGSTALLLALVVALPAAPRGSTKDGITGELIAAAAASGRPRECISMTRRGLAKGPTVWQRARQPNLQPYCDLVAKAHAQLSSDPESAKASAKKADKTMPGRAAPKVILGRAALALGSPDDAAKLFDEARRRDARSLEHPLTMHDFARALVQTKQRRQALEVYRALVPRVSLLSSDTRRASVLLEAAHVSMAEQGSRPPSPPGADEVPSGMEDGAAGEGGPAQRRALFDEAIAYLREAKRLSSTRLSGDVLLSLALVLDRAGHATRADAVLAEAQRVGAKLLKDQPDYASSPSDAVALRALAAHGTNPTEARARWKEFLQGPGGSGPWAAAAKLRLATVRGEKRKPKRRRSPRH